MKRPLLIALLAILPAVVSLRAATDDEVEARRTALELAGAFSNDGFKLRDGVWQGSLELGKAKLIQVNLYSGNEYWFSLAGAGKARKVGVSIYDETGKVVQSEPHQEGLTAAAGFSPEASGPYFVRVELLEGEPAAFCLVYSFK
ncbi:MAG TPA: hypothetical protein VGO90_15040 [Chthoniobacteraceae bacterium]|jgi:hypothetical protein|nr:hypothetical protein [Chthoniobacter sp.]HEV7869001.1 hypothetical protein [Chthoniobacteraceae bacterium]